MHWLVRNIKWDTTNNSDEEYAEPILPTAVVVDVDEAESTEDAIGEALGSNYGFAHNGFTYERIDVIVAG